IRLLQTIGVPYAVDYITHFGFRPEDLPRNLSLALGTATLTPMEIAVGWAAFANGGYKIEPYLIERVEDRDGKLLFEANPARVPEPELASQSMGTEDSDTRSFAQNDQPLNTDEAAQQPVYAKQIIDERTAYIMTSMLQDVIKRGTGRRALELGRSDIAGKTGTTNESKDSWFSGYNADVVTTVWAGFDQPQSLGRREYGGTVALPIWMKYMSAVLEGRAEHPPAEPEGLVTLRVDPHTGRAASPGTPDAYFELFRLEESPPEMSELEPGAPLPGSPLPATEAAPIDLFYSAAPPSIAGRWIETKKPKPQGVSVFLFKRPATHHGKWLISPSATEYVFHRLQRVVRRVGQGRHAAVDRSLGHCIGHQGDQARVHRLRNDVVATEFQVIQPISRGDFRRNRKLGQVTQRVSGRDLHFFVDARRANVERTAEDEGEAQHVVDLVRIVRTTGRHDHVGTRLVRQLRTDLRIRVGAGEDNRIGSHAQQPFRGKQVGTGQTHEHIGAVQRVVQRPLVGFVGEHRLVLVEIVTTGMDHALAVDHEDVLDLRAEADQQLHAGSGGGAGTEADDLRVLDGL